MIDALRIEKSTVQLMRIPFSYFLMPVFFFALSQVEQVNWVNAVICFLVLHLFIYPASNGYNSYMDQDETSIGGLEKPPKPTKQLFYTSVAFDITGLLLALFIGVYFFAGVLVYMLASRAYSYKGIRLKKFPVIGFLVVIFFQGAFTFWIVYSGSSETAMQFTKPLVLAMTGCSFLIAGVYPLTQIYQHEADYASGDMTISYKLGITGTFVFTALMFVIANVFLFFYFEAKERPIQFVLFQLFLLPVIIYFIGWFLKTIKDKTQASFKNTMRMNLVASTLLNLCFIVLLILNTI